MTGGGAPRVVVDEKPDPKLRDEIVKPLRAFNESRIGPVTPNLWQSPCAIRKATR